MATDLEASRLMVRHGANCMTLNDQNKTMYCAMAKKFATDKCFDIVNDALQLHGAKDFRLVELEGIATFTALQAAAARRAERRRAVVRALQRHRAERAARAVLQARRGGVLALRPAAAAAAGRGGAGGVA